MAITKKELKKLTVADVQSKGVQAMSNTPARRSSYGASQLTPEQIKSRMDMLPSYVGELLNAVIDAIQGDNFGEYVSVDLNGSKILLSDLVTMIHNGNLSGRLGVYVDGKFNSLTYWMGEIFRLYSILEEKRKISDENITNGKLSLSQVVDINGQSVTLQRAVDLFAEKIHRDESYANALNDVLDEILSEQVAILNMIGEE